VKYCGFVKGYGVFYAGTQGIGEEVSLFPYAGLVTTSEPGQDVMKYAVSLKPFDEQTGTCWVIDAQTTGNEARFINHSHRPNCELVTVYVPTYRGTIVWVFTNKTIKMGDELTINYELVYTKEEVRSFSFSPCHCEAPNCPRWLQNRPLGDFVVEHILSTTAYAPLSPLLSDIPKPKILMTRGNKFCGEKFSLQWLNSYLVSGGDVVIDYKVTIEKQGLSPVHSFPHFLFHFHFHFHLHINCHTHIYVKVGSGMEKLRTKDGIHQF